MTMAILCIVVFVSTASLFLFVPECGRLFFDQGPQAFMALGTPMHGRQWLYAAALTAPQVFAAVSAPMWGLCNDHIGSKRSLLLAVVGAALSMSFASYAVIEHEPGLLITTLSLLGVMDGSGVIAQAAVLERSSPERKESNVGLLGACSTLGLVCGPVIGGVSLGAGAFKLPVYCTPFVLAAAMFALTAVLIAARYADQPRAAGAPPAPQSYIREFLGVMEPVGVRWAVTLFFLMELVLGCYYEALPLLLQAGGLTPTTIGIFAAYIAALIAVTCIVIVPILERHLSAEGLTAAAFLTLSSAGLMLFGNPTIARIWLSGIPLAVGAASIYCILMARMSSWTGAASQGKISGVATTVAGIAFFFAGAIIGSSDRTGNVTSFAIVLVGASGAYLARRLRVHSLADVQATAET
jgi:MFS transporter, DHA1 family, tetracycline resistance protein